MTFAGVLVLCSVLLAVGGQAADSADPRADIPRPMQELVDHCYVFRPPGAFDVETSIKYEICPFRHVRQVTFPWTKSVLTGRWAGWEQPSGDGAAGAKRYAVQLYTDGEGCGNWGARQTRVVYQCPSQPLPAGEAVVLSVKETDVCRYELTVAAHAWCNMQAAGLAAQ